MFIDALKNIWESSGIYAITWQQAVMIVIAGVLIYMAIGKKCEPLLLLPIAFGMLLSNLPIAGLYHSEIFAGGHVHWDMLGGGLISYFIIYMLGTKRGKPISSTKLIMTGVAMGAGYAAVGTFAMYILDESQLEFIQRWNSGELWGAQWNYILILTVWLVVFGVVLMYNARILNAINLGYDTATGLGVNVKFSFALLSFIAVGMSSAAVAFGGNFFFLGLIGPHIARRVVGSDARFLIPAAGVTSSVIIVAANILVENVEIFINIPTGIFVSIISVPYFLYLLIKAR